MVRRGSDSSQGDRPSRGGSASASDRERGRERASSRPQSSRGSRCGKKRPEPEACPDPQGQADVCKDPDARPPKKLPGKRRNTFADFWRRLLQRQRRGGACDCLGRGGRGAGAGALGGVGGGGSAQGGVGGDDQDYDYDAASLQMQELLRKKRGGAPLTAEELDWFADAVARDRVEECQIGAMLMAMCINGLSQQETSDLTKAIVNSGVVLKWDESWVVVDKHSTGGVGDKVSLVLAPALASFDLKVPMLSGRGLGQTGGTLDKLESIPGFKVENSTSDLEKSLIDAGCFIAGTSENLAPADSILYSIRDVTATGDCLPLVVSSIVSKKVAGGSKILVLDIKVGRAAFYKTVDEARLLAMEIIRVSADLGIKTRVLLTRMDHPIGKGIGNALEVEDAVECMRGHGTPDLIELITVAGAVALLEKGVCSSMEEAQQAMLQALRSGSALECFRNMIACQGVPLADADALCMGLTSKILPVVPPDQITPLRCKTAGTIASMDALELGTAVWRLGAGRATLDEDIDYRVGLWLIHLVGDQVEEGDVWVEVHHAERELDPDVREQIEDAVAIEPGAPQPRPSLIIEII